jgi:hypothetical protein
MFSGMPSEPEVQAIFRARVAEASLDPSRPEAEA